MSPPPCTLETAQFADLHPTALRPLWREKGLRGALCFAEKGLLLLSPQLDPVEVFREEPADGCCVRCFLELCTPRAGPHLLLAINLGDILTVRVMPSVAALLCFATGELALMSLFLEACLCRSCPGAR